MLRLRHGETGEKEHTAAPGSRQSHQAATLSPRNVKTAFQPVSIYHIVVMEGEKKVVMMVCVVLRVGRKELKGRWEFGCVT